MKRLCRVLGASRSGFYAWSSRPPSARWQRDGALRAAIVEIHRRSRRTYGSPRIHAELHARGERCSRKRVARLMGQSGLVGVHPRRHRRPLRATLGESVDLVNRDFTPLGPEQVWAADVTQFRTGEGWLHVAAVVDLWSRRVVGWSMGTTPNAALVSDALLMAFQRRRPDHRVVHHSDRGAAYTWLAFSQPVAELELDQSLGTTGDCYDCRRRGLLVHPQARAGLDPRHHHLGQPRFATGRPLRLHRDLLQHPTQPTPTRLPKPRRLRKNGTHIAIPCPPKRGRRMGAQTVLCSS